MIISPPQVGTLSSQGPIQDRWDSHIDPHIAEGPPHFLSRRLNHKVSVSNILNRQLITRGLTQINRRVDIITIVVPTLARHHRPVPGIPHDGAAVDLARLAEVVRRLLAVVVPLEGAVDVLVAVVELQPGADPGPLVPVLVEAPGAEGLEVELVGPVCHAVVEVVVWSRQLGSVCDVAPGELRVCQGGERVGELTITGVLEVLGKRVRE